MAEPTDVTESHASRSESDPNGNGKLSDPNRRALIAGVAGLVAGALARSEQPEQAEAATGNPWILGEPNSANQTTILLSSAFFAGLRVASQRIGAEVRYGPIAFTTTPAVNATAGFYSIGGNGPAGIFARAENFTALQSRLLDIQAENFGALAYTQNLNSTAFVAEHAAEGGIAAAFLGNVQMPLRCFTIPAHTTQQTVTDPNVTADSLVLVSIIGGGKSPIVQVEPSDGSFIVSTEKPDPNPRTCRYAVIGPANGSCP